MPRTKIKSSNNATLKKKQIKTRSKSSPSIKISSVSNNNAKKVQKGKMTIDTDQMIKDLVELGRIKDNKKNYQSKKAKSNASFMDLSKSPLLNFIQEKNHGSYVRLAVIFLAIVSVFFFSILYILNSKAVISISLKKNDTSSQIQRTFNVYDDSELSNVNNTAIVISVPVEVDVEDEYAISSQIVKTEKAEGKIKIINNSNQSQGLVATTRFISEVTGDLYRLKNTVNVPAKSFIEADVYSDNTTASGEGFGTKFTIPGLRSDEMRQLIYGESSTNIDFNGVAKAIITEDDITNAKNVLDVKLRQSTLNALQDKVSKSNNDFVILADSLDFKVISTSLNNANIGREVESIKISGKARASALFVNKRKILDVIKSSILSQSMSSSVVNIKESTLSYSLSKIDLVNKLASLIISIDSYVSYNVENLINKNQIVGMNINDFYVYIQDKSFANKVQVVSYPFWNKSLPKIADNITIRIK